MDALWKVVIQNAFENCAWNHKVSLPSDVALYLIFFQTFPGPWELSTCGYLAGPEMLWESHSSQITSLSLHPRFHWVLMCPPVVLHQRVLGTNSRWIQVSLCSDSICRFNTCKVKMILLVVKMGPSPAFPDPSIQLVPASFSWSCTGKDTQIPAKLLNVFNCFSER